ncbi:MAG: bifunctional diaminohydroxyphosphoribosylaminopyrimidine deaminase/5-amino-6-(5-phosphoribosylamino)uracil reductase RibD [Planctomycetota bacterium]
MTGSFDLRLDRRMLEIAARVGLRGWGRVSPNPMVGCVIGTQTGAVLGIGHHRMFGGAHAEVEALRAAHESGHSSKGATAWVTLEPCSHTGKTPPCARALLDAGIARVVCARPDTSEAAGGGCGQLRAHGVSCEFVPSSNAWDLAEPWHASRTAGRPWTTLKWAQTLDGAIADHAGASQWLSNARSRWFVHAWRGRVDAVVTGIGTVLADDPRLTARSVRPRRTAARIVLDPWLDTPEDARIFDDRSQAPLMFVTDRAEAVRIRRVRERGARVLERNAMWSDPDTLGGVWRQMYSEHEMSSVLVEAGGGVATRLLTADLVDELLVFVTPKLLGDARGVAPVRSAVPRALTDASAWRLVMHKRFDDDIACLYRRPR